MDIDSDWKVYAPVGEWAIVDAWVESGGPVYLPWSWNWESGGYQDQYDEEYSSMSWGQYSSSGIYDVYVYASSAGGSDDAHSYVYAVAVTQVISSTSATCVGQNVTFGAITNPLNCAHLVSVTWSGGGTPSTGSGSQFTTSWSTGGTKTVTATCGSSNAQKQVTLVEVASVTSDKETAVLCENVTFTVTTNPPGYGSLVSWSGGGTPATGSGSTFTTCWNCTGTKTVTATCVTSSKSKNVTVSLPSGCLAGSKGASFTLLKTTISSAACKEIEGQDCGLMDNPENFSYTVNARYDNNRCEWVFDVQASAEAPTGTCSSNYINVVNGNEAGITKDNYDAIVFGFRYFNGCIGTGGNIFSNSVCSGQHEDNHFEQFVEQLELQRVAFLSSPSMSDMPIVCGESSTETCQNARTARYADIVADILLSYGAAFANAHDEVRAEAAARECFEGIADIVEAYWE